MPNSDSDSDTSSYTETNVLLGYAEKEPTEDTISHLGGEPQWLTPASPADARLAKCANCNNLMTLLLQLNAAICTSPHERRFYVFVCTQGGKSCRRKKGSIKVLRGFKRAAGAPAPDEVKVKGKGKGKGKGKREEEEEDVVKKEEFPKLGDTLFGTGAGGRANPFSTSASTGIAANPFSTKSPANSANPFASKPASASKPLDTLSKSFAAALDVAPAPPSETFFGTPEPWPAPLPHTFPLFYLDADYETLSSSSSSEPLSTPVLADADADADADDDVPLSSTTLDSSHDKTFQKFADCVAQNPEQVLRYERGGEPLLYSRDDEVGKRWMEVGGRTVPRCTGCGGARVWELQVMPYAINVVEEVTMDGMEWGCVHVAGCVCEPRGCGGEGYVEEWCGVQWEQ